MSDNDDEELRNAIDKYINAIRTERRVVDQRDSTKTDQGDREPLGARDLEAMTGLKVSTWRFKLQSVTASELGQEIPDLLKSSRH